MLRHIGIHLVFWCFVSCVTSYLDCTQSLSFLVHSNWETGASERQSRPENGEEMKWRFPIFSPLFPILRAAFYLAHSSLARDRASRSLQSPITKRKKRDCVQSTSYWHSVFESLFRTSCWHTVLDVSYVTSLAFTKAGDANISTSISTTMSKIALLLTDPP